MVSVVDRSVLFLDVVLNVNGVLLWFVIVMSVVCGLCCCSAVLLVCIVCWCWCVIVGVVPVMLLQVLLLLLLVWVHLL